MRWDVTVAVGEVSGQAADDLLARLPADSRPLSLANYEGAEEHRLLIRLTIEAESEAEAGVGAEGAVRRASSGDVQPTTMRVEPAN